jgi:2-iminobutanoate/2-iminopropanoate deaminase
MGKLVLTVSSGVLGLSLLGGCVGARQYGFPWVPQGPGVPVEEVRAAQPGGSQLAAFHGAAGPASSPSAATSRAVAGSAPVTLANPAGVVAAPEVFTLGTGYTQATRYGDLLFISGQIPMEPASRSPLTEASIQEQTRLAMENVRAVLEANHLTMAQLVATTVYLKNINDLREMDAAYARFFSGTMPSRTVVEVARLPRGALVEIAAIAGR